MRTWSTRTNKLINEGYLSFPRSLLGLTNTKFTLFLVTVLQMFHWIRKFSAFRKFFALYKLKFWIEVWKSFIFASIQTCSNHLYYFEPLLNPYKERFVFFSLNASRVVNNRLQRNVLTWNNFEFLILGKNLLCVEKTKTFT